MRHLLVAASLLLATSLHADGEAVDVAPVPVAAAAAAARPIVFSMGTSAEWSGEYPRFLPLARAAGVTSFRLFPEWHTLQPAKGEWSWARSDAIVAAAAANGMEIFGGLAYLAPWASSGNTTRQFPLKDAADWGAFAEGTLGRYKEQITYWEVYNEFNGGFAKDGTPADYAAIIRQTKAAARRVHPEARVGIGCADVDLSFLERTIAAGAGGEFDFITVHPYSLLGAVMNGREEVFLRLGDNLRRLLAKTGQRPDVELLISEIGMSAREGNAAEEQRQAAALVKAHTLAYAQGFTRLYWFEGRGPQYGKGGSFGVIRQDWSLRPSYTALQTLTTALGSGATRLGWFDPNAGASYGFGFNGAAGPVLVMWANGGADAADAVQFPGPVTTVDLAGARTEVAAGTAVTLTADPLLITGLPAATVATLRATLGTPFPWLQDYSAAESVSVTMGASNVEDGLLQAEQGDGMTRTGLVDGIYARRTQKDKRKPYMYFDVDDSYATVGDHALAITVTARCVDPKRGAAFPLLYESAKGYKRTADTFTVPKEEGWHSHTFTVADANFANNWGWNFRLEMPGSPGDVWIKEVRVKRLAGDAPGPETETGAAAQAPAPALLEEAAADAAADTGGAQLEQAPQ